MDKLKYQYEGVKWLVELELLNHPQVINTIRFNVLLASKRIKEVELLIYRENKSMLVLVDLTWMGRKFFKQRIFTEVQDVLTQLLPSFRFRITDDPRIMELAVERVKQALTGGKNENTTNESNNLVSDSVTVNTAEPSVGSTESIESSSKEQPESTTEVRQEPSSDDSKQE